MAKQGGMGDLCFVDQYDISGDIGSLGQIGGGPNLSDVTDITQSGMGRIGLLRDGRIDFSSWFNPDITVGAEREHLVLKALPTTDRIITYWRGAAVGNSAASLVCKQINYDGNRGADGSLNFSVNAQANGFGIEWGEQLTAGKVTQGAAGNGTSIDFGSASTAFGWSAYLHLLAFTGTSITVAVQDSADNVSFADLTTVFTTASARGAQRITAASATATVRRYVRFNTTGTFSNAVFGVNFVRYLSAQ